MANMALPNVWHENTELGLEVYSDSQYWYVKVKESGYIRFSYPKTVDIFLVGGGGAGASGNGASGGGGGYARTWRGIGLERNVNYHVEIGRGGIPSYSNEAAGGQGGDGGATRFTVGETTYEVEGGKGGIRLGDDQNSPGGAGGCGGGAGSYVDGQYGGDGGSNAGNGGRAGNKTGVGGVGQAQREGDHGYPSTTRAFGTGELYAGGGGGSSRDLARGGLGGAGGGGKGGSRMNGKEYPPEDGQPNTGGGGGGQTNDGQSNVTKAGGAGGSGVVIIRGDQLDLLPVWFDGVQLSDIFLNDVPVENMWFGDLKLF